MAHKRLTKSGIYKLRLIMVFVSLLVFQVFSSHAETPNSIHFAVIGDYGNSGSPFEGAVAEMVRAWGPDFIVTTGDNNYPDGDPATIDDNIGQYYSDYIGNYQGAYGDGSPINRFFPALGNHDYGSDDSLTTYLDYFSLPGNERYYDFVQGPVQFFVLNTDSREPDGNTVDSVQANWLKQGLAASTARWKVVIADTPPYSSGWHGSQSNMQWPFKQWGADLVLSGDDHQYERIMKDGLPYLVVGNSGREMRVIENAIPDSVVRFNASYGALFVTATADQMHVEFHSINGKPFSWVTTAQIGDWLPLDLTGAVTGNGVYDFAVTTGSNTSVYVSSKEGDNPPQLVVDTDVSSYVFPAIEDAYVDPFKANENFGNEKRLHMRNDHLSDYSTYLRFQVSIKGNIQKATLQLYPVDGKIKAGFSVFPIVNLQDGTSPWGEATLNFKNAPMIQGLDEPIDSFDMQHSS